MAVRPRPARPRVRPGAVSTALTTPGAPRVLFSVDLGAIAHNVAAIRRLIGDGLWLCASLKADAYGFGLVPVAHAVVDAGADAIAVGDVADGITLRRAGVTAPILVYAGNPPVQPVVEAIVEWTLTGTVHDHASLDAVTTWATRSVDVFLEVASGLQRLGVAPAHVARAAARLRAAPRVSLAGVYTHLHVPDGTVDAAAHVEAQFARFVAAVTAIGAVSRRMAASSRVLASFPHMQLDAVDPGRALFGLSWHGSTELERALRPAFAGLRTRLLQVRPVSAAGAPDDAVLPLTGVSRIGVLPVGRYHGLDRLHAGHVLVRGRRAAVLGAASLEHCRVDLSGIPEAQPGDEVVIIGTQGGRSITTDDVLAAHPDVGPVSLAVQVPPSVGREHVHA
jgi:alanine racemase